MTQQDRIQHYMDMARKWALRHGYASHECYPTLVGDRLLGYYVRDVGFCAVNALGETR